MKVVKFNVYREPWEYGFQASEKVLVKEMNQSIFSIPGNVVK